ncbi:MAG: helix-turn-helix domain-containing protein [Myxococcota bacterium]|nr:helix-turn-helix domain-containing protein [Myxococcota bacterium]
MVAAVCKAGAALFAERGPGAVSSREIAARAGVNYGLLHRHFGSREALVSEIMTRLSAELGRALDEGRRSGRSVFATLAEQPAYARALARAALDGFDMASLQDAHPILHRLVPLVSGGAAVDEAPLEHRAAVAAASAAFLGWAVFGSFLAPALRIEGAEGERAIEAALRATRRAAGT